MLDAHSPLVPSDEARKLLGDINDFLTPTKIANLELAIEEKNARKLVLESMPPFVVMETTNVCNLRCPLCPTGVGKSGRKKGYLDLDLYKRCVDEVASTALSIALENWGEPTLHKEFLEIVRYAALEKKLWLSASSNMSIKRDDQFLEDLVHSGLAWLLVDIDGTTQETYEKYRRRGDLPTVLDNTRRLMAIKKALGAKYPIVEAGMIVMSQNEHQIDDFVALTKELGVDRHIIKNVQINPEVSIGWYPKNEKHRYGNYIDDDYKAPPCDRLWMTFVLNHDGGVSACCIVDDAKADFDQAASPGKSIAEIWNNDHFQAARSVFSEKLVKTPLTICHICRNNIHKLPRNRVEGTFAIKM